MFKGQPKGLFALALANTGERFGYYTMLAVFVLFLKENFGFEPGLAGTIYSTFLGLVYFMPLVGGILADKFGFGKMVTIGIYIMFLGYVLLAIPLGSNTIAIVAMAASLLLISIGTGLFKGNLQVMVGNLYDDPKYSHKRDAAFSIFYMAINIGALFAPTAAMKTKEWAQTSLGYSSNDAYHFAFAVACAALILSILIYYIFRPTFRHVEGGERKKGDNTVVDNLTPQETKSRIIALFLVFAVVIFFWMAFHQNGLTLTYFADEYNVTKSTGVQTMLFDVWNLITLIIAVYATFSIFQSEKSKGKLISGFIATAALGFLVYRATGSANAECKVDAPIFQQFNPFYVVALTPVSMAIFGALAKKGKEPSAPRKIAYGMLVAAIGFGVMAFGSKDLNTPKDQARAIAVNRALAISDSTYSNASDSIKVAKFDKEKKELIEKLSKENKVVFEKTYNANLEIRKADKTPAENRDSAATVQYQAAKNTLDEIESTTKPETRTSSYWLIITYLILTFAELLLSPMGISFVSKVAPPKYKGLMMGCWFAATSIGNMLVAVGGFLWAGIPLSAVWGVFIALCLLSALFMFVMMKRLEKATN